MAETVTSLNGGHTCQTSPACDQTPPQDLKVNKIHLFQWHRQMGVVMRHCTMPADLIPASGAWPQTSLQPGPNRTTIAVDSLRAFRGAGSLVLRQVS